MLLDFYHLKKINKRKKVKLKLTLKNKQLNGNFLPKSLENPNVSVSSTTNRRLRRLTAAASLSS